MGRVYLGCLSCLRGKLFRAVYRGSGERGAAAASSPIGQRMVAWVRHPLWAIQSSLKNLFLALALPRISPTRWLRNALAEADIAYADFQRVQKSKQKGPMPMEERLRLGSALVVLMRAVAQADSIVDPREWKAMRTYLRALYAAEPELARKLDPGIVILPAPGSAQIKAATQVLAAMVVEVDQELLVRIWVGIAIQKGAMSPAARKVLLAICRGCGFDREYWAEIEDLEGGPGVPNDDPWVVLGLSATSSALEIRRRYLKLAMKHHPDRQSHLGGSLAAAANRRMTEINLAYDRLQQMDAARS
jgi:DnaJ like chaperone protein